MMKGLASLLVAALLGAGCTASDHSGTSPSMGPLVQPSSPSTSPSSDEAPVHASKNWTWTGTSYEATYTGPAGSWVAVHIPLREPIDTLTLRRSFQHKVAPGAEPGVALRIAPGQVAAFEGTQYLPGGEASTTHYGPGVSGSQGFGDARTYVGSGQFTGVFWAFGATRDWSVTVSASLPEGGAFELPLVREGTGLRWWEVPMQDVEGVAGTFGLQQSVPAGWAHVEFARSASATGENYVHALRYRVGFPSGFSWPPPPHDQTGIGYSVSYDAQPAASGDSHVVSNRVVGGWLEPTGMVDIEGTFAGTRVVERVLLVSVPEARFDLLGLPNLSGVYAQF